MESPKWLRWPHPAQFGTHHNGVNDDDVGDSCDGYGISCDDDDDNADDCGYDCGDDGPPKNMLAPTFPSLGD